MTDRFIGWCLFSIFCFVSTVSEYFTGYSISSRYGSGWGGIQPEVACFYALMTLLGLFTAWTSWKRE